MPSRSFYVHAELLTSRSRFFAKALKNYSERNKHADTANETTEGDKQADGTETGDIEGRSQQTREKDVANTATGSVMWLEGEEGVVSLPVDEPEVFAGYVQLLYTGLLPMYEDPPRTGQVQNDAHVKEQVSKRRKITPEHEEAQQRAIYRSYDKLSKLYIFCEKIQDVAAKSALLAAFVEVSLERDDNGSQWFPDTDTVRGVYAGTLALNPLRTWLVNCYVIRGRGDWMEEKYTDFPHEFLHDVVKAMYVERGAPKDRYKIQDVKYYQDKLLEVEAAANAERTTDSDSGSGSDSGS